MPHNVGGVIGDIEDVKDDLHDELKKAGRSTMTKLELDVIENITQDAHWTGRLRKSVSLDVTDTRTSLTFSVNTDPEIAPHAPFVEFGTGARAERAWGGSLPFPAFEVGDAVPAGYPYEAPGMSEGLVESIIDWVETKPVIPDNADMSPRQLGHAIAAKIANRGTFAHPFLRPAWFQNERLIKDSMKVAVRKAVR